MFRRIPNIFNLLVVIYVALGSTTCSYSLAVTGSTLGQPTFYTALDMVPPGEPGYGGTANLISGFNGGNAGGGLLGCIFVSWFGDWAGRKRSIQLGCLIAIVGAAITAGAVNPGMFVVGRLISGLSTGILVTIIPMYQSEVSTPASRGFMTCMHGIMFAVGYSLSGWIGFGTYFSSPTSTFGFRFPLAFQAFPPLLLLAGSKNIPFSPRWLLQQNRHDEALSVLLKLHSSKEDPEGHEAKREFYQMKKQLELDRSIRAETGAFEVFRTPSNRKRALFSFGLMFGNQFTGVLIVANYGVVLYEAIGFSGMMPLLLNACWVTVTLPLNVFTALYVDRIGRKVLLLVGLAGTTMSNIFEIALQATYVGTDNRAGLNAAIFFIFFFIFFWASCLDATQFVYVSEIFPTHIRSQGTAVGMCGLFAATLVVLVAGPIAFNNIGWKFYLIFIIPPAIQFVLVYIFFPETKQRSLEDIAEIFGDRLAVHYYQQSAEEREMYERAEMEMAGKKEAMIGGAASDEEKGREQVENVGGAERKA